MSIIVESKLSLVPSPSHPELLTSMLVLMPLTPQVVSVLEIPEEVCDLNPLKTCRFATKLVRSSELH